MSRRLKPLLRRLLPRPVIEWLKRRLEASLFEGATVSMTCTSSTEHIHCTVADNISFLAPLDCEYALAYDHMQPDCRGELSGIVHAGRQGGVLFDYGAHAGIVSTIFCAAKSTNVAYSFEPSPTSQKRLQAIRDLNKLGDRMLIEPFAVGEKGGTVEMLHDPAGGYVQVQQFAHSMWSTPGKITIQVESVTDASTRLRVVPDYIKLDVESYEYEAIIGAHEFLRVHRPVVLLELHLNYLEERGRSARHLVETLGDCGYSFFTYGGRRLEPASVYDSPLGCIRLWARCEDANGDLRA